jgi:hypothetical protein
MVEAGVIREDQRVELLDGDLCDMMPIGEFHASVLTDLTDRFGEQNDRRFSIRVQSPLLLDEHGLVQPDLALVRRIDIPSRTVAPAGLFSSSKSPTPRSTTTGTKNSRAMPAPGFPKSGSSTFRHGHWKSIVSRIF